MHNNASALKTEDEQVKALVDGKSAFTAGGQWCTLGFTLLGSSATLCAQQQQLNQDTAAASRAKAKVKTGLLAKIEKADLALCRFRGPDNMNAPNWKITIGFLLPIVSPGEAASKIQTVPLIKAKLTEIERDQKKQWDLCMEGEIIKARAKFVVVGALVDDGNDGDDIQADIGEDGEASSGPPEVVGAEAGA